ncbi:hypothetical protein Salat_0560200 [Sesamum alatum]|uniref:Serine aminopeptidase S33 domain-containing protein n=1 Tax=Sesamum alatum TaxID=300844 RepID=A0AAE1YPG5_9LAMI|nr:hypothetical protein Salat_0560200 [Sesamum alatum]
MEQLINFIIRPPRAEYNPKNDLLDQEFMLKGKWYQRKDLEVVNSRGDVLQCSHYMPIVRPEGSPLPCVIYCHGNSGCRTDASEAAIILLPSNITVFTLDFSGSGLSGGEHVTLGWNEKDDLKAVVDYLREDGNVSLIGLWGRSMGAVTSLMYGAEDPSIAGMVLDSPFSDLVDLMMELVDTYKVRLPKFTVKFAIQYMRRAIQKKAKFDIMDLNAIKVAKSCFVPVLFGHAIDDDFIQPHHSDRIFDAYVGDKNIIKFEGDHNSPRPQFYFDSISIFFNNVLQPPEDEVGSTYFDLSHDYFPKGNWSTFHDLEYPDELLGSPAGPATSSTEDAIKQLRSKRPMSMIVVPADISSKDKQPDDQVESRGSDSQASSSNMISFELSGASPHGSNVPASIDDDEYVEYPLDSLADFPSNAEEEERMLMEAVLESLKDLEVRPPRVEEPSSNGGNDVEPKPAAANGQEDSFSTQNNSLKAESVSTSADDEHKLVSEMLPSDPNEVLKCSPSPEVETQETGVPRDPAACNHIVSDADNHPKEPSTVVKNPTSNDAVSDGTSCNNTPSGGQSSSEVDMVDRTKVTVKVVKNPTNNIMDGLLRRWDLNFFRNR